MFDRLLESGRRDGRRVLSSGTLALAAHGAIGAAAVWATLQPQAVVGAGPPPIVIEWPREPRPAAPPGPPDPMPVPPQPVFDVLTDSPIGLPLIDRGLTFDPAVWLRDGESAVGGAPSGTDWSGAWSAARVEEPPALLAGPAPAYPEALRRAGIAGRVVVEAVVDTLGRAEPRSVSIVTTPHPGFVAPARDYVLRALFRPGCEHGRAVRVLVRLPIDFALTTAR